MTHNYKISYDQSVVAFTECTFTGNYLTVEDDSQRSCGGAFYIETDSAVVVKSSIFMRNKNISIGGAICVNRQNSLILNNVDLLANSRRWSHTFES